MKKGTDNGQLIDVFGRKSNYLRLSITDRCNLRCFYCRSHKEFKPKPHREILRPEEFLDLVKIFASLGVNKIRLTGGEPLLRRGLDLIAEGITQIIPDCDLKITTNGVLLKSKLPMLVNAGLKGVNISLDTLQKDKFKKLTGTDALDQVLEAIDASIESGLKVKVNCVALAGMNDDELPDFIAMAQNRPIDLRFIEFMPIGKDSTWDVRHFWSSTEIMSAVAEQIEIEEDQSEINAATRGPAKMYRIKDGLGRIGAISPMTDHFCGSCNRLRISCDGNLRTCLYSDRKYNLGIMLRNPKVSSESIRRTILAAQTKKPLGYKLLGQHDMASVGVCDTSMVSIGG